MKNTQKRINYSLLYVAMIIILLSLIFLLFSVFGILQKQKIVLTNSKQNPSMDNEIIFSEDQWRKQLEAYLLFKEQQDLEKQNLPELMEPPIRDSSAESDSENKEAVKVDLISPVVQKNEAYFTSSLTSNPGSVALSGKTVGYQMEINGISQGWSEGKFTTGVASQFQIRFFNSEISRTVHVSSPPYSTNVAVQYLTIGVDPFGQYMSLHGKIALNLPGTMQGELLNLSTGAGSSTMLENGAFSLSVPLAMGDNYITATGSWLTISLDLPSIKITLSD